MVDWRRSGSPGIYWLEFDRNRSIEDDSLTKCRLTRPPKGWRSGISGPASEEGMQEAELMWARARGPPFPVGKVQSVNRYLQLVDYKMRSYSGL